MTEIIPFANWVDEISHEIETVSELLHEKLQDNPMQLYHQLVEIEAWNARFSTLLSESATYVALAESSAIKRLDPEFDALQRKVTLRAEVAQEHRIHDILEGITRAIRTRTILGCNLRKTNAGERVLV